MICNKSGCKYEAQYGFVICGKHMGWGQDNKNADGIMCVHHTDKYACVGYTVCGYCLGYGKSCWDTKE